MSVRLYVIGTIAAGALVLTACGSSGSGSTGAGSGGSASAGSGGAAAPLSLTVATTGKGDVLADGWRTLYTFDPDTASKSACTGPCATLWPPVIGTATPGPGLAAGDFSTITRDDGSVQVTYRGHPVYEYAGDKAPGDTNGDGVMGKWHVAKTSAVAGAPSPSDDSSSSGGYNY